MVLSYGRKFIFFHVPKTAGVSIRTALEPYAYFMTKRFTNRVLFRLGLHDKVAGWSHHRLRAYPRHFSCLQARQELPGEIFDDFFKFGFVRNPWDWQVSLYHYILKTTNLKEHPPVKEAGSFAAYLHWRINGDRKEQSGFLTDEDGNLLVDFVGHFEKLPDDLRQVCERMGIRPPDIPHLNPSGHRDYHTYYTAELVELVAEHYQRDIDLFGYTFE